MIPELPKNVAVNIENFTGRTWLLPHILKWLDQSSNRMFILQGEPGTGKSNLVAWLAGAGPLPGDANARTQLEQIRSLVGATHFCNATSGNTAPNIFAQNMAEQLSRNVAGFSDAFVATLTDRVQLSTIQNIGTVQPGGNVTAIKIERFDTGSLSDEMSFDRLLREPLKKLYNSGGYQKPMLLLVDALDEAMTYTGSINIVQLLTKLSDLPDSIRIIVTTRPDPRVLYLHHEIKPFDLIKDAPVDVDDVRLYVYERLAEMNDMQRNSLAGRISKTAEGIFLYAHLILNDFLPRLSNIPDLATVPLPKGLSGFYLNLMKRELGKDRQRWFNKFESVLGLIAVAQGAGLSRAQIERISGQDVREVLEISKQYLDGDLPQGPFRPFHKSFADFLLEDKENDAYHIEAVLMHQRIADHYCISQSSANPWRIWDPYGLRYAATHLAKAAQGSIWPESHKFTKRLVKLVVSPDFQAVHQEQVKDLSSLQRDLEQALRIASGSNDSQSLPLVIEIALSLTAFRREQLRPESLFDLARKGEVEAAARRLDLFDVDFEWQQASLLIIAWLASQSKPEESCKLRDRIKNNLPNDGSLSLLLKRLNANLEGPSLLSQDLPPLPSAPPEEIIREIVARMGGMGANAEMLTRFLYEFKPYDELLGKTGYMAEQDGPLLIAYTVEHPQEGNQYFRQYLATHTSYNYVQYRNRSLWLLLDAVLRHPDQKWVEIMVPELAVAALAGSTLEFQEGLPVTILGLQALAEKPGALQALENHKKNALNDAKKLTAAIEGTLYVSGRGQGDVWGSNKRRLSATAQIFSLLPGRNAESAMLLDKALNLPYGFAGFQSPACMALAEAIRICRPDNQIAVHQAMEAAQVAAHNIQDATFCARSTARFNAMSIRWWGSSGFDVRAVIKHICHDSSTPDFAALHFVGEQYQYRSGAEKVPLPEWLHHANTLKTLAEVYHRPLAEFQRLNPTWAADEELKLGTQVNVPDPGFATLLAARFAAEALVETSLSAPERMELIQSLVPVSAINPTALDAVLSRLLLAARPKDMVMLDALEQLILHNLALSNTLSGISEKWNALWIS